MSGSDSTDRDDDSKENVHHRLEASNALSGCHFWALGVNQSTIPIIRRDSLAYTMSIAYPNKLVFVVYGTSLTVRSWFVASGSETPVPHDEPRSVVVITVRIFPHLEVHNCK